MINKYNEIKLNKTSKTLRNNLAYIYFEKTACRKLKRPIIKPCVFRRDCLDIEDRELCNNSPLVEAVNLFYNLGQNICRLFHFLAQFFFTTSETELDYYHQKVSARVASRVAKRLKT